MNKQLSYRVYLIGRESLMMTDLNDDAVIRTAEGEPMYCREVELLCETRSRQEAYKTFEAKKSANDNDRWMKIEMIAIDADNNGTVIESRVL